MDKSSLLPQAFTYCACKGGHIMVGDRQQLIYSLQVVVGTLYIKDHLLGNDPFFCPGLAHTYFHAEPAVKLAFLRPDLLHLRS